MICENGKDKEKGEETLPQMTDKLLGKHLEIESCYGQQLETIVKHNFNTDCSYRLNERGLHSGRPKLLKFLNKKHRRAGELIA